MAHWSINIKEIRTNSSIKFPLELEVLQINLEHQALPTCQKGANEHV